MFYSEGSVRSFLSASPAPLLSPSFPFVLPVAFPWMLLALFLGSPLAALLCPCPSPALCIPLALSPASMRRKAWRIRENVHSWLCRELGLRTKLEVYFWRPWRIQKCCKDRKVSLGTPSVSLTLGCPGPGSSCATNANTHWIYPMEFPDDAELVISVEIDTLVMNFIWENHVIFGSVSALKWQQLFYIPQQAQKTI